MLMVNATKGVTALLGNNAHKKPMMRMSRDF